MSFLLGNDYFEGIPNVGPVTARKSIETYGTIPAMKKAHPRLFRELHRSVYRKVRGEFLRPKYKEVSKTVEFGGASADRVKFLLLHEHGLSDKRVLSALKRLEKARKKAATNPALTFARDPLVKTKR